MGKFLSAPLIAAAFLMTFTAAPSWAAANTVKVTPLGSLAGEFCNRDRAIVFEDPNGTRILYDAGRTVRGSADARLGNIDVVLLSSVHDDHIGDRIVEGGPCGSATTTVASTKPISNTAQIAADKDAEVYVGGEMSRFLGNRIAAAGGSASQAHTLRPGATAIDGGVEISVVMAIHSNGVNSGFVAAADLSADLAASGLTAYTGPDHGYILKFTNGLVVYLTADTGHTSDMKLIVKDFYHPKLVVINMGDVFSMGPREAAFAINHLIKPRSVIPEHANEGATSDGVVLGGTKTEAFIDLLDAKFSVHVPLSDITMEFNGQGKCVAGC